MTAFGEGAMANDEAERSMNLKPIVTLTVNPSIDASASADEVQPTHKIRTSNEEYEPGGGGINVARVVRELGGDVRAIYLAGGLMGQAFDNLIDLLELPRSTVPIKGATRVSHSVFDRSTGQEYRFVPEGPEIRDCELQSCLDLIDNLGADYLVASGSLPGSVSVDFYAEVARLASRKGMRLILDTSGEPLRSALEEGVYLVKPNLRELTTLVGKALPTTGDQRAAAEALISKRHAELVAVSLGTEGALLVGSKSYHRLTAPKVAVKSTVGAGDSFVAALALSLAEGRDLPAVLALAVAAGTAAVMTEGTQLCRRQDVETLFHRLMRENDTR